MKLHIWIFAILVCFFLLSVSLTDSKKRKGNKGRRPNTNRRESRGNNPLRPGKKNKGGQLSQTLISVSTAGSSGNLLHDFTGSSWISSSDGNFNTLQWSTNDDTQSFSDWMNIVFGNPEDVEDESFFVRQENEDEVADVNEEAHLPWRGKGSFTGDMRLHCLNKRCSKGIVQVYNREQRQWGNICGDRWTIKESRVVCNYLQFSRGARKAIKLKKRQFPGSIKSLPTMYRGITCTGRETDINICKGQRVTIETPCDSDRFAGVVCSGKKVEASTEADCSNEQMLCRNHGKCILPEYRCDGMSDCPWGSDEENCEESNSVCSVNQFWCGRSEGGCISNSYLCDGDYDCLNENDEENCEEHLNYFEISRNRKLRIAEGSYNLGWRNISPYLCAKKCREENQFRCISFDYNKDLRECDLSEQGSSFVGIMRPTDGHSWDHYEMYIAEDCSEFECGDMCISTAQICDGNRDCGDGSDENGCEENSNQVLSLRLAGGSTWQGRLEIQRGNGEFGLICDIEWTIREANVACRQLGFRQGALLALPGLMFHRTNLKYQMSGVNCSGHETSLNECDHHPWNNVQCRMDHEAGVACISEAVASVPTSTPAIRRTTVRTTEITTTPLPVTSRSTSTRITTNTTSPTSSCGVKNSDSLISLRIVNGNNALKNEWPWQVGIWLPWQLLCGGTLINECWVLTAAHCFSRPHDKNQYTIRLGDHLSKVEERTEQDFKIEQVILHEYNSRTHDNDIALIQLQTKNGRCAELNRAVKLACLPQSLSQFQPGKKCHIIGWGQTQSNSLTPFTASLKEASVPLISRQTCISDSEYGETLTTNMLCAGYLLGGIDTCQGDSGGPLLCQSSDDDRYYIWGVVSWGNGCARPRAPGIYTVVANYLEWISRNTGLTF